MKPLKIFVGIFFFMVGLFALKAQPMQSSPLPDGFNGGGRVVFISDRSGLPNLWILDMDTNVVTQLTDFPGALNITGLRLPRWSSDGRKIAFGAYSESPDPYSSEIYVINEDGTGLRQLTNYPGSSYYAYQAAWDPTNASVLFYTKIWGAHSSLVHRLDIVSGEDIEIPNSSGQNTQSFDVTSDSQDILFCREPSCCWTPSIYTGYQNLAGSSEQIIKPSDGNAEWLPRINRKDNWILYYQETTYWNPTNIYKMDQNGYNVTEITLGTDDIYYNTPVWTSGPKDGYIIFGSNHFDNPEICMMKAVPSDYPNGIINLTNSPYSETEPDWTPFKKDEVTVRLIDHNGQGIAGGEVKWADGSWHAVGLTGVDGTLTFSPGVWNKISISHHQSTEYKYPGDVLIWQTVEAVIKLIDHTGNTGIPGANIAQGGKYWDTSLGSTGADGSVSWEVFPNTNNKFRVTYNNASVNNWFFIGSQGGTALFQTGRVYSETSSCTYYAQGVWKPFIQNIELLPGSSWHFKFNDGFQITYYTIVSGELNIIH